ncbi:alkyl sulfatase dimerization domain-containing protein [Vibrio lentus]|uniref:alkyl sulfatase dimerization domain-containing protein n=1 Tax=Vibrio lentus TaxID=136468 RepID=UPI000C83F25C|nr:alkyl sulfatase dimerization domain-containing protein [Vibrio lentus]PMI42384.1 MBL fold metallo-hydrolase [Vibrio lentus]PMJ57757.1 MBL fold metallo-hydrolase [Vibrio lentus]
MKKKLLALSIAIGCFTTSGVYAVEDSSKVLVEHESGLMWGEGKRVTVLEKTGINLAYTESNDKVAPELTNHSRKMDQAIIKVDHNVYKAYGFGVTSPVIIEGDNGIIVVDPGESVGHGKATKEALLKYTDKPVVGVVYTHNHIDHVAGVRGWVTDEEVASGKVKIYAHDSLTDAVANWSSNVGNAISIRTSYSAASIVDSADPAMTTINDGLGPRFQIDDVSFITPTDTFAEKMEVELDGVKVELHYIPSETNDEIVVYLPEQKILHAAEVLQGENFPNLHTIRGTKFRDSTVWFKGIDMMRELDVEVMVLAHGRPVEGKEAVANVLTAYRDAIQYTHDQTIRYINEGYTPDELVEVVKLPEHLQNHPWLGQFYGTVEHSVRQLYVGYLGWFEADPWALEPIAHKERAERYVELMGGREAVLKAAKSAFDEGEYTWAAEILTNVIRIDHSDMEARKLKAQAYRHWGSTLTNINWRNWTMTAIAELENEGFDWSKQANYTSPDVVQALPTANILSSYPTRLVAEDTIGVNKTLVLEFTDTKETFGLEIRNGITQMYHKAPNHKADVHVKLTREMMNKIILTGDSRTAMASALEDGSMKFETAGMPELVDFLAYFKAPSNISDLKLIVR